MLGESFASNNNCFKLPTASWVENDFESRPVEHLKDIIDNEFECLIDIENDQEHISRSFDHVNLENLAIFKKLYIYLCN
jgi:hypothetical protein